MYLGLRIRLQKFLSYNNTNRIFKTDFEKFINIKLKENPSLPKEFLNENGQTERRTNRMKITEKFE